MNHIIVNNRNFYAVYEIFDGVKFGGIRSLQVNASEIADYDSFLKSGIFSVGRSGLVEIVDYGQNSGFEISSNFDLKKNIKGFIDNIEVISSAVAKDGTLAVVSTGKTYQGTQNCSQNSLILLNIDHNFRISILDNVIDHDRKRKKSRCYTHLRLYQPSEEEDPLLICFEGKRGYMEVFEKEKNPRASYSADIFMIRGNRLCFVETLKDYHKGNSFKNEEVNGAIWSVDNTGRISQLIFE